MKNLPVMFWIGLAVGSAVGQLLSPFVIDGFTWHRAYAQAIVSPIGVLFFGVLVNLRK
jgi:hypothetical protein